MAASSTKLRTTAAPHLPAPPTPDEETDLLTLAVEYRRLRNLEHDLALSSPTLQPPLLPSARARLAGYGVDIDGYESALRDGQKARDELVTRNMGLVHHVVSSVMGTNNKKPHAKNSSTASSTASSTSTSKSHSRHSSSTTRRKLNSLTTEDLIQEGALGLARAVDKYDPTGTNGARFATYAVYWIRAAVLRCIAERDDLVRVPEYVSASVRKLTGAARRLGIDLDEAEVIDAHVGLLTGDINGAGGDKKPLTSEVAWRQAERARLLAEEAGLSERQLSDAVAVRRRRLGGGYTALDGMESYMMTSAGKGAAASDDSVAAATAGAASSGVEAAMAFSAGETTDDATEIRRILSAHLRPKEMEALSWRYGLNQASPSPEYTKQQLKKKKKASARDYEEEALEDLFGTEGLLASYSSEPQPSKVKAILSSRTAKTTKTNDVANIAAASAQASAPPKGGRWGEAMSFAEVGRNMAVSAEYGRRLCSQALKKLRTAADEGRLELQPDWLGV